MNVAPTRSGITPLLDKEPFACDALTSSAKPTSLPVKKPVAGDAPSLPAKPTSLLVKIPFACDALSISRTHLYALHRRNELDIVKIGGSARVRYSDLLRLAGGES